MTSVTSDFRKRQTSLGGDEAQDKKGIEGFDTAKIPHVTVT